MSENSEAPDTTPEPAAAADEYSSLPPAPEPPINATTEASADSSGVPAEPVAAPSAGLPVGARPQNRLAVIAFALSLASIFLCGYAVVLALPAVLVGTRARKRAAEIGEGKRMALASLIIGSIMTVYSITGIVLVVTGVIKPGAVPAK